MREPRLFTLEEALQALPRVRDLIEKMQACKNNLDRLNAEIQDLSQHSGTNGHSAGGRIIVLREQAGKAAAELENLMTQLQAVGCELKGLDQGLVDFPSMREGRVVYLCWQSGEDTVAFWHDLDTGFAGRQPL